jgi:hypothetical protein
MSLPAAAPWSGGWQRRPGTIAPQHKKEGSAKKGGLQKEIRGNFCLRVLSLLENITFLSFH